MAKAKAKTKAKAKASIENKLPLKINPCYIKEAIIEIRFESKYEHEVTLAMFQLAMRKFLPKATSERLPIADLPFHLRENENNLKYQAYYRFESEHYIYQVGPRVLAILSMNEYPGWGKLLNSALSLFKAINDEKIIKKVVRVGMRYLTVFEGNVLHGLNVNFRLEDKVKNKEYDLLKEMMNFRTVIERDKAIVRLQLSNMIEDYDGTIVDIDVSNTKIDSFFTNTSKELERMHTIEKELFFGLLKPDFLEQLNPEYEDNNEKSV